MCVCMTATLVAVWLKCVAMVCCCARRRCDDSSDDDLSPLRRRDYDNDEAIDQWARLFRRWRRVARLKHIWAFLGHRLRQIKNGG